ncbi:lamin tail domain-containing protein [Lacinutrix jangbogonensis]|uniref:lamin tail domain-containing protein n=1 Tax=Lacinutrix jangbogonensis TaxID=1469557 RepID=UPI0009DFC735|nr:lamin tail domain-containing protein [Lacinutrix jangbogonensis]
MKHIKLVLIILFISLSYSGYGQIYTEDFTGQANKGARFFTGPGTVIDVSGVNWNVTVQPTGTGPATGLDATNDWFRVRGNAANRYLEARDVDGPAVWLSPIVNITGFTSVGFSLLASERTGIAGNDIDNLDTLVTEYRIDGGAWTIADTNGSLSNDYDPTVVSQSAILSGTTIELRVTIDNDRNNERMRIDDIVVTGTPPAGPVIIVNPTSAITGLTVEQGNIPLNPETFTVEGYGLGVTPITITPPTGFVVATSINGPYSGSVTTAVPDGSGTVSTTTIYVQLEYSATTEDYFTIPTDINFASGATTESLTITGEVTAHTAVTDTCSELIISEYHESNGGSGRENYIELYNPTASAIDLSDYRIARFVNGRVNRRPAIRTLPASLGSIAPNSTFLIARTGSDLCGTADYCNNNSALRFNGNDVMALQTSDGVNIDVVGEIGVNNNFGRNVDLARNQDVDVPTVTYDASGEWTSSAANNTSMLGFHISDCKCTSTSTFAGGLWSPSFPNIFTNVIIATDYDTSVRGPFSACSITVNSGITLTVTDNFTIAVDDTVVNNGTISVATAGSLVQVSDNGAFANIGSGTSSVTKHAAIINSLAEYTYWSSPVHGEVVNDVFPSIHQNRRYWFDASNFRDSTAETGNNNGTVSGQDDVDDDNNDWQELSTASTLEPGFGFITYPATGSTIGTRVPYTFTGPFNNGTIAVPIFKDNAELNDNNWNLIGNPYPSAVSTVDFFAENVTNTGVIDGTIYLWSHNSPVDENTNGNQDANYGDADYAMINAGSGGVAGGDGVSPNNFIPSGQGFMVHFSDSSTGDVNEGSNIFSNAVIFNNSMRAVGNNNQFFKTSNSQNTTSNKFWLNLTTENGVFSQILISYLDGATAANDGTYYEATRSPLGYSACLYSTIPGSDKVFAIQGKASGDLTLNEEVPLGIYTIIDVPTTYTISIAELEGTFFSANTIYLEDALLNTTHDLSNSDYSFTSATGEFNERFKVVFTTNTLSTDSFETMSQTLSIVELEDDNVQFSIASSELTIKSVKILDLLGRTIYNFEGKESTEVYNLANISSSIYVAQIELSNGAVISKKAVKK